MIKILWIKTFKELNLLAFIRLRLNDYLHTCKLFHSSLTLLWTGCGRFRVQQSTAVHIWFLWAHWILLGHQHQLLWAPAAATWPLIKQNQDHHQLWPSPTSFWLPGNCLFFNKNRKFYLLISTVITQLSQLSAQEHHKNHW